MVAPTISVMSTAEIAVAIIHVISMESPLELGVGEVEGMSVIRVIVFGPIVFVVGSSADPERLYHHTQQLAI